MRILKKKLMTAVAALVFTVGAVAASAPAAAAPSSTADRDAVLESLEKFQVPEDKWESVLSKFDSGQPLDSFSSQTPILTEDVTIDGELWTIVRYEDGSYEATLIEGESAPVVTEGQVVPYGVSGCSVYTGSGYKAYTGCKVQKNMIYLDMSFYADYQQLTSSAQINSIYSWDVQIIGASYSVSQFAITKSSGWSGSPATATLKISTSIAGGWGSSAPWIRLDLTNLSASVAANW